MSYVDFRHIATAIMAVLAVLVLVAATIKGIRARKLLRDAERQERLELAQWFASSGMTMPPADQPRKH